MILLEVCLASVECATAAANAGANRIELNSTFAHGGLTPSQGLVTAVRREVDIPIVVMIRPRPGDFTYSGREFAVMEADADALSTLGADGLALGILTNEGHIDRRRTRALIERASGTTIVFHRAFDEVPDPFEALEQIIDHRAPRGQIPMRQTRPRSEPRLLRSGLEPSQTPHARETAS